MKKKLLILLTLFLVSKRYVYGQHDTRWAIGVDLLSLTDLNTSPKYSLYTRYKLSKKDAIRFIPSYYNVKVLPGIFDIKQQKTYGVRLGYERVKLLYKQSFYLLYGIEYIYYNDHQFSFDYNNPTNQQSFLVLDHIEKGAGLFIGGRYFIIPNLSISTESTLQVTHTKVVKARLGIDEFTNDVVNTLITPITRVNICFHF